MEENKTIPETSTIQQNTLSILERTELALAKLEQAEARNKELLARNEAIYSRILMSGKTEAGQPSAAVIDPEKEERERINKILAKTGLKI